MSSDHQTWRSPPPRATPYDTCLHRPCANCGAAAGERCLIYGNSLLPGLDAKPRERRMPCLRRLVPLQDDA